VHQLFKQSTRLQTPIDVAGKRRARVDPHTFKTAATASGLMADADDTLFDISQRILSITAAIILKFPLLLVTAPRRQSHQPTIHPLSNKPLTGYELDSRFSETIVL
jgi:hypothetical protein